VLSADPTSGVGLSLVARLGRVRWSTASSARAAGTAGPGSHAALELPAPFVPPFGAGHRLAIVGWGVLDCHDRRVANTAPEGTLLTC